MRNVVMIRREPGLVSIPVESAVYCENCETVSTSSGRRCGLCGSEDIARLVPPNSGAVGSEPGSSRGLGRIANSE